MRKALQQGAVVVWVSVLVVVAFWLSGLVARAGGAGQAPQDYSYVFNQTNLYADDTLEYFVSGLDVDVEYVFDLQLLHPRTGEVVGSLGTVVVGPGVSSQLWSWDVFSDERMYPFRVVDQYGRVLGRHHAAPVPHADWFTAASHASDEDKTAIGHVVYEPRLNDYQHDGFDAEPVTTVHGGYALLHYLVDASTVSVDVVVVGRVSTSVNDVTYSLAELVDYNTGIGWSTPVSDASASYVALSTDGSLPWVNPEQAASAFVSANDVPHEQEVAYGAYDYLKSDSIGNGIAAGESVWLVTRGEPEMRMQLESVRVKVGREQTVRVFAVTEEVYEDLSDQFVFDADAGVLFDDPALWTPFGRLRGFTYEVATVVSDGTAFWNVRGADDHFTAFGLAIDPGTYAFTLFESYEAVEAQSAVNLLLALLRYYNVDDPLSVLLGMVGFVVVASLLLRRVREEVHPLVYGAIYAVAAVCVVLLPLLALWLDVLLGLSVVLVLFFSGKQGATR